MRDRGTFNFSGNLEVKKDAPLEARSLVNSYADLVKPETWTDEQGGIWKYDCMLVSCKDRPGKVYQLSPGADYTKESSWILIGDTSELNNKVQEFIDSKGAPNGLASLNESGIIPSAQLPSYVDDVIEVDTFSNLPGTGESGKIYIVQDTNLTYRWSGTDYVEISKSLALGETSSTAYPGDKGKATTDKLNRIPDKLITDTVDVNQSTTEAVLKFNTYKQEAQQIGRNTLTITSATTSQAGLMSSSDKTKLDGLKDQAGITSDINAVQTNLETHINNKSNPHEVTKDQVGLGNVDNTSDANKPISNATQTALNGKFSATDGNALKQTIEDMPNLVVTEGSVSHKNNNISLSLRQQDLKDPVNTDSILLTFNPATDSTAGIILPSDKSKIDKIITNGNGTKYLSDNGTYKEVSGGGESNIYVFSPTISGNGISEQDYNNFKAAANEGKVILVPNTLHNRKIGGQFVPINYYGTSNFVLTYIRPLEEADGTLVSDLCMVYIYNTYEIGGTAVRITNAKNLIIPDVKTIVRPVSLQGQDAQSKINELFSSAGNFKDVVEDMLVNHTRYYFHFDNKLTNCIELGCVNPWRNYARTSYELHFIVVYNTDNTYYTSKVSVIYDTDINNTKYHVTNLIQSDNDLLSEIKNLQIVHDNEFNFANDSIGDYVWINYRSRYDAVTSAESVYVGNGQAGADGAFGAIHASGFFKESDVRLKSNIVPLNHTLDQICNIPTVEFDMHDKHQIGTVAQDLENNFAEIVNTDSDGMKSVDYCMLGVVAIEGVKLLRQEIEDLKKQIQELKNGKQNN